MKASALECPTRFFVTSFSLMNIIEIDGFERMPSTYVIIVNPCRCHQSMSSACSWLQYLLFFFHISCPLLHNLVDFKTDGFVESCPINFLGLEKREDHLGNSSICDAFIAEDTFRTPVGPVSDEDVASSSMRFLFLYI